MQFLKLHPIRSAVIALIIANTIWGAAPPIFKWALTDIGPFTLAFMRFFFAALIMFPFAYKNLRINKEDIRKLFLMAFLGITINISFFFVGLKNAQSINAGIIGSAAPIFIIFGSFIFLREKVNKKIILGAHVGLLGVLTILLSPLLWHGVSLSSNISFAGNMMFVVAMLGSLGTTLIGRKLMEKYEPAPVVFWAFLIGSMSFFPFFFNELSLNHFHLALTTKSEVGAFFGIFLSSAAAYYLFFLALKYLKASESSVFTYIDPVVTVIIAIPLLGEYPNSFFIIGSLLVFLGIYISEGRIHWHPIHLLRKR